MTSIGTQVTQAVTTHPCPPSKGKDHAPRAESLAPEPSSVSDDNPYASDEEAHDLSKLVATIGAEQLQTWDMIGRITPPLPQYHSVVPTTTFNSEEQWIHP